MVQDRVLAEIGVDKFAVVIYFADGDHEVRVKVFILLSRNIGIP